MTDDLVAPLASIEDLSVINTPLGTPISTPRSSPSRNRTRWSQRSSLDTILDEGEEDDIHKHNQDDNILLRRKGDITGSRRSHISRSEKALDQSPILETSFETESTPLLNEIEPMSTELNIDRLNQSEQNKDRFNQSEQSKDRLSQSELSKHRLSQSEFSKDRFSQSEYNKDRLSQSEFSKDRFGQSENSKDRFSQLEYSKDPAYGQFHQSETSNIFADQPEERLSSHFNQSEERTPFLNQLEEKRFANQSDEIKLQLFNQSEQRKHSTPKRLEKYQDSYERETFISGNNLDLNKRSDTFSRSSNSGPSPYNRSDQETNMSIQFLSPRKSFRAPKKFEEFILEHPKPQSKDRFFLVFFIILVNSCCAFLPFSLIILVPNLTQVLNISWIAYSEDMKSSCVLPLSIISIMSATAVLIVPFVSGCGSMRKLMVLAQILIITAILSLIVYIMADTASDIRITFSNLPLIAGCIISISCGVQSVLTYSLTLPLSKLYRVAFISGMGLSFLISSLLNLLNQGLSNQLFVTSNDESLQSSRTFLSVNTSAIYVLILVLIIVLASADLHLALPLSGFFEERWVQYSRKRYLQYPLKEKDSSAALCCSQNISNFLWIFLQAFITFLPFPFLYTEFNYSTLSVEQTFFIPALIFIPHSIGFIFGSLLVAWTPSPPSIFSYISLSRIFLVPVFFLTNLGSHNRVFPVVLWDWALVILVLVWALVSAYSLAIATRKSRSSLDALALLSGLTAASFVTVLMLQYL